jgi:hypothetical protein
LFTNLRDFKDVYGIQFVYLGKNGISKIQRSNQKGVWSVKSNNIKFKSEKECGQ